MKEKHGNPTSLSRRDALQKLAKLSSYSAPVVTALLTPSLSYSSGSAIPEGSPDCNGFSGKHFNEVLGADNNANVVEGDRSSRDGFKSREPNSDHAKFFNSRNSDTAADCGQ